MLLEKINKEEIELAGYLHDPKFFSEVLFDKEINNLDSIQNFSDDSFFKIRFYQIPFLSYEYLLAYNPELTLTENFELKKGCGTAYIYCGRKIGKCEWEENECLLSDGTYKKFKDLKGKFKTVFSLNKNNKLIKTKAYFFDNGLKDCLYIKTESGKEITVTLNHPLLSDFGWKKAKDLKINEFIATPKKIPFKGKQEVPDEEAKLLGYLLGDGSTTGQPGITNINKDIIKEIYELANFFNCNIRNSNLTYYFRNKEVKRNDNGSKVESKILKLVRSYNINCLAKNKRIPKEIFKWKNNKIALLLNRLFACDGHVNNKSLNIEYSSASKGLTYDIQSLLLRFGIHSFIKYKKSKCKNKYFDSWRLYICADFDKFLDDIGVFTKDKKIRRYKIYSTSDRIPRSFYFKIKKFLKGIQRKYDTRKLKIYDSSRLKWQKLAKKTKNEEINKIAFSDIYWEKIKEIKIIKDLPTIGVSVPLYQNYISNNIISHNSLCGLLIDLLLDTVHNFKDWVTAFSSFDEDHVNNILDPYVKAMKKHPFFCLFKTNVKRRPTIVTTKSGHTVKGINMNLSGREPGSSFESVHANKIIIDEQQYEIDTVFEKRSQSTSEKGCIERFAGITSFTNASPAGRIYNNLEKRNWLVNIPQTVSAFWNKKRKEETINMLGDSSSIAYKIHVSAEVVEDAEGIYDIERIRKCYFPHNKTKPIKAFDISKETFLSFKDRIIVERPNWAKRCWIAADFGVTAPTEIIILFEQERAGESSLFRYIYNITLNRLIPDEQTEIFKWLIKKLNADYISLDCTELGAQQILQDLGDIYSQDKLIKVQFNSKMIVGYEKDDKGAVILENGKMIPIDVYVIDWAVEKTKEIFYNQRIDCKYDMKLDKQFNAMVAKRMSSRIKYGSKIGEDHLHSAFLVFNVARFLKEENAVDDTKVFDWGIGVTSYI